MQLGLASFRNLIPSMILRCGVVSAKLRCFTDLGGLNVRP
jgi:hypothetical protein